MIYRCYEHLLSSAPASSRKYIPISVAAKAPVCADSGRPPPRCAADRPYDRAGAGKDRGCARSARSTAEGSRHGRCRRGGRQARTARPVDRWRSHRPAPLARRAQPRPWTPPPDVTGGCSSCPKGVHCQGSDEELGPDQVQCPPSSERSVPYCHARRHASQVAHTRTALCASQRNRDRPSRW